MQMYATPRYLEIVERYNVTKLVGGGNFTLTPDDQLATTLDGDIKIGDDIHSALHRLVVGWQFNEPIIRTLLDIVESGRGRGEDLQDRANGVALRLRDPGVVDEWHDIEDEIGSTTFGSRACAGTVVVVLHALLDRELVDLGRPKTWDASEPLYAGRSFGAIVRAAANNFRHADEWARNGVPDDRQRTSITVLADVLDVPLSADGANHRFRHNVCPEVLQAIAPGGFEQLATSFFSFARNMAM
jgi:hypothetical protein